jgi:hypothetical protein
MIAKTLAYHRYGAYPVKAAQRAPKGSLDGLQGSTLGHAVQDDMAACTACEARFGFCV